MSECRLRRRARAVAQGTLPCERLEQSTPPGAQLFFHPLEPFVLNQFAHELIARQHLTVEKVGDRLRQLLDLLWRRTEVP